MSKSTAGLGRELGLNCQEMNILLRNEGYLEGEPGNWKLTEKGQGHAAQQHWDVSSSMHEGYVTTRWGDEVLEELGEVGPERKQQIDDEISARRAELRRQRQEQQAVLEDESDEDSDEPVYGYSDDEDAEIDGKTAGIIVAAIAGGILFAKGAKWVKPRVEKWWNETAQPKLAVTKKRLATKFKMAANSHREETIPGKSEAEVEEIKNMDKKNEGEKN